MLAWCAGLGRFAAVIAPIRRDGTLLSLGVRVANGTLVAGWYAGDEGKPEITEAPWLDAGGHLPAGWLGIRSATPAGQTAWAWRWTLDELVDRLSMLLDPNRRSLASEALKPELIRKVAVSLTGRGSLDHRSIPLAEIDRALDTLVAAGIAPTRDAMPGELGLLSTALSTMRDHGEQILSPVYPAPDLEYADSWVWSPYSKTRLLERTTKVFGAALAAYEELTGSLLAPLRARMQFAVILPARLTGRLSYRRGPMGPGLEWHLEPLPMGSQSIVDITLADDSSESSSASDGYDLLHHIHGDLTAARPQAASWLTAVLHHEALHIFDQAPASRIALKWINDDLTKIGWRD